MRGRRKGRGKSKEEERGKEKGKEEEISIIHSHVSITLLLTYLSGLAGSVDLVTDEGWSCLLASSLPSLSSAALWSIGCSGTLS